MGAFLGFLAIILVGMTVIAMNIWGPYMIEYKNFSDAFIAVLFIHMGKWRNALMMVFF